MAILLAGASGRSWSLARLNARDSASPGALRTAGTRSERRCPCGPTLTRKGGRVPPLRPGSGFERLASYNLRLRRQSSSALAARRWSSRIGLVHVEGLDMVTRRSVIRMVSVAAGFVVGHQSLGLPGSISGPQLASAGTGESYGGFVLMPWGSPPPQGVQPAPVIAPPTCQGDYARRAVYETVHDRDLPKHINFRFYTFGTETPSDSCELFSDALDGIVSVTRIFWVADSSKSSAVDALTLVAARDVSAPVPIWPGGHPEVGLIAPTKVDWTPRPGLSIGTGLSEQVTWVENNILYALEAKRQYVETPLRQIVESLQAIPS